MKDSKIPAAILTLILIVGCLLPGTAQAVYKGDKWADAQKNKAASIVLTYVETPGFAYKDASGNVTGICIDIMNDFVKYVEKTKGVKLSYKFSGTGGSFKGFYDEVKRSSGGVFGLGNVTITDVRRKEVKFSPAFINNVAMLVSHSDVPTLTDMKALGSNFKDMKAYVAKGSLHEKRINDIKTQYYPSLKVEYTSSSPETLEKVLKDKTSFSYLDMMFYLDAVKNKQPIKRHSVGDKTSEEFGIIMPMDSDWSTLMQDFFAANGGYRNSSDYKKILTKHLGTTGAKLLESASAQ